VFAEPELWQKDAKGANFGQSNPKTTSRFRADIDGALATIRCPLSSDSDGLNLDWR
jgi:hypothetical protein